MSHSESIRRDQPAAPESRRRPRYEAPMLIRVHVDPVDELLLATPCQPLPNDPLCTPPYCS